MPRSAWTRSLTLAAATLAIAACGGDTTAPASVISDTDVSMDVAAQAGDAVASDVAAFTDVETIAGLGASGAAGCALANGRHRCTDVTASGVTMSRSYAYLDAAGASMASYDAALTASVDVLTSISGSASGTAANGTFTATFARARHETLSGLAGAETQRTWNGTSTGSDSTVVTGASGTRTYVGSAADTTAGVLVRLPRSANPYPLSGQRIRAVTASVSATGRRTAARQVTRRAVVSFNGTANVPLTVNGVACTLHLDTRKVDGCTQL